MKLLLPTVSFILFTSKKLTDGDHPVMLRTVYRGERRYYAIEKLRAKPEEWIKAENKNGIPASFKGLKSAEKNKKLRQWEVKVANALEQFDPVKNPFSFHQFENLLFATKSKNSVYSLFEECIQSFHRQNKFSSRDSYKETLNRIKEFRKNTGQISETTDLSFVDLDLEFLERYREYYIAKGYQDSSLAVHLRIIRAVYNHALRHKFVDPSQYPFKHFKIKTPKPKRNRSLEKSDIHKLLHYKCKPWSDEWNAVNLFLFSYYCHGMNLGDMLNLKWNVEIGKERIIYQRNKTTVSLTVKLANENVRILSLYKTEHTGYAFPFYEEGIPESTKRSRRLNLLKRINKNIKIVCKKLDIPLAERVTFYWARHTFTNVLIKENGHPKLIQGALGHLSFKTTDAYTNRVKTSEIDSIQSLL